MEDSFIIEGGKPLVGEVTLSGAKNLSLKAIIASLLFDTPVTLKNVPRIKDVTELLHILSLLQVKYEFVESNTLVIHPETLSGNEIDFLHGTKTRVSFMLIAPLLHRFGSCKIPNPGGCRIGLRPIDRSVNGLIALGAQIEYDSLSGYYVGSMSEKPKGSYTFEKASHTGTELLIMYAVKGDHEVTIHNAALEPEIDELIVFLNEAGARITRNGTTIKVHGVSSLTQKQQFHIFSDRNEAITFAILGMASRGSVKLKNFHESCIKTFIDEVRKTGCTVKDEEDGLVFEGVADIKPVSIETMPHPGFMTDWQPNWAVFMTQAKGVSTIHERVFENRFAYVSELLKLGAEIEYLDKKDHHPDKTYFFNYDPNEEHKQWIQIKGGAPLHGGVMSIFDLRAGATVLIAGLIAQGQSVLLNASILERGYENIVEKITALGGTIRKT